MELLRLFTTAFEGLFTTAFDEQKAVFKIVKILDALDEDGRKRAVAWLQVHYPYGKAL